MIHARLWPGRERSPARPGGVRVWSAVVVRGVAIASLWSVASGALATEPPAPTRTPLVEAPAGSDAPLVDDRLFEGFAVPDVALPALPPVWPARVSKQADGTMGVVVELPLPRLAPTPRRSGSDAIPGFLMEPATGVMPALLGEGATVPESAGPAPASLALDGAGSLLWRMPPVPPAEDRPQGSPPPRIVDTDGVLVFLSSRRAAEGDGSLVLDATWFLVRQPAEAHRADPKGLAILMPGLFGLPPAVLERIERGMSARGWMVIRMIAQPASLTARRAYEIDPSDLPPTADAIAGIIQDRTAECAYAVEAVARRLESQTPALAARPRVILGISMGAITLPTVVAREPSRYAGAVMIGGGCCFWHTTEVSSYTKGTEILSWTWLGEGHGSENGQGSAEGGSEGGSEGGKVSDATKAELRRLVLERTSLDPFHTATVLQGMPTLVVHGNADVAVPSPLGKVLWERSGKGELWSYPATHEGVTLVGLPPLVDPLVQWLDAAGSSGATGAVPDSSSGAAQGSP